jgi:hydroxyacylglutathione hydrolase
MLTGYSEKDGGKGPQIYTLRLRLSNVHLVTGPHTVLFDSGSPGQETHILNWIDQLGLARPRAIILTHAHADHAGSAVALRRITGARIGLAAADWPMAAAGRNAPLRPVRISAWPLRYLVPHRFAPFTPDVALDGQSALAELGLDATLLPTSGHTPGSVSVLFKNGQAIVGDLLMGGYIGGNLLPHRPRPHYFATNPTLLPDSLARVLTAGARTLHVGHGGPIYSHSLKGLHI